MRRSSPFAEQGFGSYKYSPRRIHSGIFPPKADPPLAENSYAFELLHLIQRHP